MFAHKKVLFKKSVGFEKLTEFLWDMLKYFVYVSALPSAHLMPSIIIFFLLTPSMLAFLTLVSSSTGKWSDPK